MAFNVGDQVIYGVHGVCRIVEIEKERKGSEVNEYYKLRPVFNDKATVFVPKENEKLVARMRRILSADEIIQLIHEIPREEGTWIMDENVRKEQYKKILSGGDRKELMRLIKMLYLRQQERTNGRSKKLYKNDEKAMHDAEKMLYDEFAYVLDIKREQVIPFIMEQIEVKARAGA